MIEPVSSTRPRLTAGDKIRTGESNIGSIVTLLCPMQGLPVPLFR